MDSVRRPQGLTQRAERQRAQQLIDGGQDKQPGGEDQQLLFGQLQVMEEQQQLRQWRKEQGKLRR